MWADRLEVDSRVIPSVDYFAAFVTRFVQVEECGNRTFFQRNYCCIYELVNNIVVGPVSTLVRFQYDVYF